MIRLAIPKGRLSESVADLLQRSGYDCAGLRNGSRRLAFTMGDIEATLVKPSDVAVYVEHGAADIGVVGKDVLMEDEPDVFELMDLGFGACRMVVAAPAGFSDDPSRVLRVASKYPHVAGQPPIRPARANTSIEKGGRSKPSRCTGASSWRRSSGLATSSWTSLRPGRRFGRTGSRCWRK